MDLVNVVSSGTEIMVAQMFVIHDSDFEILDKVKDKLSTTNQYGFTGDNVEL